MKKISLFMILTLFLTGCSAADAAVQINSDEIITYIKSSLKFEDEMTEINGDIITLRYGEIDALESIAYVGSGATAEEFAFFRAKSKDAAENIYKLIKEHIENMKNAFSGYMPKEVQKLDNSCLLIYSECVIFAVSADSNTESIIKEYFK